MRLAVLAALMLSACASGPRLLTPNRYTSPPGVPESYWGACWQVEEMEALKLPSYRALTPTQKYCALLRLTAQCVREKKELLRLANAVAFASCDWRKFDHAVEDADNDQCSDPDEGLAEEVDRIVIYLNGQRQPSGSLNRSGEVCPTP